MSVTRSGPQCLIAKHNLRFSRIVATQPAPAQYCSILEIALSNAVRFCLAMEMRNRSEAFPLDSIACIARISCMIAMLEVISSHSISRSSETLTQQQIKAVRGKVYSYNY